MGNLRARRVKWRKKRMRRLKSRRKTRQRSKETGPPHRPQEKQARPEARDAGTNC